VPVGVESRIVDFLSSGNKGIEAVLALRQVCITTKSWVGNLLITQAHRAFSMAFVSTSIDQVDENYVTNLNKFPPPMGVSTLRIKVHYEPDVDKHYTHLQKFADFWCPRLEHLTLEVFEFDLDNERHRNVASIFNNCLEKSANLRQLHFLSDRFWLYALSY